MSDGHSSQSQPEVDSTAALVKCQVRDVILAKYDELEELLDPDVVIGSSPDAQSFRAQILTRTEDLRMRMPFADPDPAEEPDAGSNEEGEPADQPDQPKAEKRLGNIMNAARMPPIAVDEFVRLVQDPVQGERADLEDTAFKRLMRGYDASEGATAWRTGLGDLLKVPATVSVEDQIKAYEDRNRLRPAQRLKATQRALHQGFQVSEAHKRTQHLLEHIFVASFALDWLAITGENSNHEKYAFYSAAYQDLEEHRAFFASLSPQQRDGQMKNEHKDLYNRWHVQLEPQITARNRFVDLYMAFGPLVFLDPFWNVKALTNNAHTKEFPVLLSLVLQNIPRDDDDPDVNVVTARYRASRLALRGTLRAIDPCLWPFARDFFDANPDSVPPPN
ncbi:hypothetical protein C8R43DRAFT_1124759 [Mycena crocata]|nr:hypothetical protein C8R43DRAFT_1124759 [Mycena crocata]